MRQIVQGSRVKNKMLLGRSNKSAGTELTLHLAVLHNCLLFYGHKKTRRHAKIYGPGSDGAKGPLKRNTPS